MFVKIEEIKEAGLVLDEQMPVELLREALAELSAGGFRAPGGFRLHAKLVKVSGGVLLDARFNADLVAPCKRCLAEVDLAVPVAFTLNFVPLNLLEKDEADIEEKGDKGDNEGSFKLHNVNDEPFDGKRIDLDPILREQVLLALPISVVCRDDCKGLCSVCGQNLNEKECGCERKVMDPRLAALKNIKLN
jgi:uncharacterized protein